MLFKHHLYNLLHLTLNNFNDALKKYYILTYYNYKYTIIKKKLCKRIIMLVQS